MKIKKWAIQTKDGKYVNFDESDKIIFTKNIKKALLLDTKEDALDYTSKDNPWKPKCLVFELVDKPTRGWPKIYKWVIQITETIKFYEYIRNCYVSYDINTKQKEYVKRIEKATLFNTKEDTLYFQSDSFDSKMLKCGVKKLTFELVG
jgi:hypothetical protein